MTLNRKSGLKFLIAVLIVLLNPFVFDRLMAQTVAWARSGVSEGFENGNAVATDDSGNVYVTGQFEFLTDFGTVSLYSDGSHDIFVAKYNTNGDLVWINKAGGRRGDVGHSIGIDAMHNVYVTGEVEDTVKFSSTISVISKGGNDIFLAKYSADGKALWAKSYGAPIGTDKGRGLAVTPAGNCYFTGYFTYTTLFDNISISTNSGNDMFVAKVNTDGDVQWAKGAGGGNQDRGYGIVVDQYENVYVTGVFGQSATFKNTTITNSGLTSTFIAKYDSAGSFQWVRSAGNCCDTTKANSIALDAAGNIYLAGSFNDSTTFDAFNFVSRGMGDVFIVKYDPSGNALWAQSAGSTDDDGAYGIAVDNFNQVVYITGLLSGTSQFNNQTIPIVGYRDIFIAAYSLNGNQRWVKTQGNYQRDGGAAITVDRNGNIYATGFYNGTVAFGPSTLYGYPNEPWSEYYVEKLIPPVAVMPSSSLALSLAPANCYDLRVNTTPGDGDGRIIIAHLGAPVNAWPSNSTLYTANSTFGTGTDLGNGNFIVYDGPSTQTTVTGLTPGAQYFFAAVEYNGYGILRTYNTMNAPGMSAVSSTYSISLAGLQSAICAGDQLTLIAGGTVNYEWSPATGLSNTNSAMVVASPAATTTYTVAGITANGCDAQSIFTITVNPLPVLSISQLNPVCENSQPVTLNIASPSGGTYSGTGVSGGQFIPSLAGPGVSTIDYSYTTSNGCTSTGQTTVMVNATPRVVMTTLPPVCLNSATMTLNNGSPLGGTYSGAGVTSGIFTANNAGNYQVYYSYTDNNSCASSASTTITVNPSPNISLGNDTILCADDHITLNPGSGYSSYMWSNGSVLSSLTVDSSGSGIGYKNVYVEVANSYGCTSIDTVSILFDLCAGIASNDTRFTGVSVYPNPSTKYFSVSCKEKTTVTIYDVAGKTLHREENVSGEYSFGDKLAAGTYYVQLNVDGNKKVYKVLKL